MSMDWKERVAVLILFGLMINAASVIILQTHVFSRVCPACSGGGSLSGMGGRCYSDHRPEYRCPRCGLGWNLRRTRRILAERMFGVESYAWWESAPLPFFPWHHPDWSWTFRR